MNWNVDFGRLLYEVTDGNNEDIRKAVIIGSKPPENDSLWSAASNAGFKVVTHDRNCIGKEKMIDSEIDGEIYESLYEESKEGDTFVLISGDSDFVPAAKRIKKKNRKIIVASFNSPLSAELKKEANDYIELDSIIDKITHEK